jgi:hypothetical protein
MYWATLWANFSQNKWGHPGCCLPMYVVCAIHQSVFDHFFRRRANKFKKIGGSRKTSLDIIRKQKHYQSFLRALPEIANVEQL